MYLFKCDPHIGYAAISYLDSAISPGIADKDNRLNCDVTVNALPPQICFRLGGELLNCSIQNLRIHCTAVGPFADRTPVGKAHAICRQNSCQRMDHNLIHAQCVGNKTRMLPPRATKTGQRIACYIMAALHRDFFDRVCHVGNSDGDKALGNFFCAKLRSSSGRKLGNERLQLVADDARVERLFAILAKYIGEMTWDDFAE